MDQNTEFSPEYRFGSSSIPSQPRGRERFSAVFSVLGKIPQQNLIRHLVVLGILAGSIFYEAHQPPKQLPAPINFSTVKNFTPTLIEPSLKIPPVMSTEDEPLTRFEQDKERITNTLRWKKLAEQVIADKRLKLDEKNQAYWIDHMLKIIATESGGNPYASSGIAFGLTQLKPETAREQADKYQIRKYDLYNSWDNLFLGTAYQLEMAKRFGPEIGAWAHHIGQGNINTALRVYFISHLILPIDTIAAVLENNSMLLDYIDRYNVTPEKLLASPAVTVKLKAVGAWSNRTWEYPARFKATGVTMGLNNTG